MSRPATKTEALNIEAPLMAWASLFGCNRRTLEMKLRQLGIEIGRSTKYKLTDAVRAYYGNFEAERTRKMHHDANIAELDEQIKRERLLDKQDVIETWAKHHAKVKQVVDQIQLSAKDREKLESALQCPIR